jgi:hypothetical protein
MNRIMASISARVYDFDGCVIIKHDEVKQGAYFGNVARRATRTATLDGSSALFDTGYSSSDNIITIKLDWNDKAEALRSMVKTYSTVIIITPDGAFVASPYSFREVGDGVVITLNVIEDA